MRLGAVLVTSVVAALAWAAPAHAAAGLTLGFSDREAFTRLAAPDIATNLQHARSAGASVVRFELTWADVAPTKPPSPATAADPAWSGYRWTSTDATIRAIAGAGLRALPIVMSAPGWAEGAGRPHVSDAAPRGTWRPSPTWYRAFATALARRYSGKFGDPLTAGAQLPDVNLWQVWNEPNLTNFITPQWRKTKSGARPLSPTLYRSLLNGFYAGIKAVAPRDTVVTAGTAPYGDPRQGDPRMRPAQFWRELLCVRAAGKGFKRTCRNVTHFDAAAHHPYPIGPPRRKAINADDVSIPDLRKITRPLAYAVRAGTVSPRKPKPLWITEISWDSTPDPTGLSLADQAQYLEGALYVLWHQGADAVIWWTLRDEAPQPSYDTTYQSGIFQRMASPSADRAKPSFTAFRFPFTAYRTNGVASIWGKAPGSGQVTIEARSADRWTSVLTTTAGANQIFSARLRVGQATALRARWQNDISLTWTTF